MSGEETAVVESAFVVPADHPAFDGHFPGRPILPGVVLLGWVTRALADALGREPAPCEIVAAKFLRPVAPGTTLRIRLERQRSGAWRFDILAVDDAVATGTLRPAQP